MEGLTENAAPEVLVKSAHVLEIVVEASITERLQKLVGFLGAEAAKVCPVGQQHLHPWTDAIASLVGSVHQPYFLYPTSGKINSLSDLQIFKMCHVVVRGVEGEQKGKKVG
jgi:hypothetical protein